MRNQSLSLQGFGPLDIIVDASTEESLRQPVTLATATATRVFANDQRVPFGVRPLAGDGHGNLVCEVKYRELAGSSSVFDRQVQVLRGDTLELVASARVPLEDYYVAPKRLIDIGPDGSIWCMVPERDGVSFRVLDLQPGALAPRIQTQAADIGEHVATWFHSFVSGCEARFIYQRRRQLSATLTTGRSAWPAARQFRTGVSTGTAMKKPSTEAAISHSTTGHGS